MRVDRRDPGSFRDGYENGGTYTYDNIQVSNIGGCSGVTASYDYTSCSFSGTSAFRCEMETDPVADADAEYGYCKYMMVYEAQYDGDSDAATPLDRAFLTAHAQALDGPWVRYLPSASGYPSTGDIRLQNTAQHQGEASSGIHSFVSVPTLHWDENAGVHRMWFVTEDTNDHSVRYSETPDDGQTWGIGGVWGNAVDCWDGTAFDPDACVNIEWIGTEPPDEPGNYRSPDIVDPEALPIQLDADPTIEVGMMFAGSDGACANEDWGVFLWQRHDAEGDQAASDYWDWDPAVEADATDGVVLDGRASVCGGSYVMDPEIVRYASGKYIMFYNYSGSFYVAGSGFACSNWSDDDADGNQDYGVESALHCVSPTDDSEAP